MTNRLFSFQHVYANGSIFYGTVADDGSYGYSVGEVLPNSVGGYDYVYAESGSMSEPSGTVVDTDYYVAENGQYISYIPSHNMTSSPAGLAGLGSEQDSILVNGVSEPFNETQPAPPPILYSFQHVYANGSIFYGTVSDNGTYGYHTGEVLNDSAGGYDYIYANDGVTSEATGSVVDSVYYIAQNGQYLSYTPSHNTPANPAGLAGLGSEQDSITVNGVPEPFTETDPALPPPTLYSFQHVYANGSIFYGTVADNGTYGYHTGEVLPDAAGGYDYIYASDGPTGEAAGTVIDTAYYYWVSGQYQSYTPSHDAASLPAGMGGLGSEDDAIVINAVSHPFNETAPAVFNEQYPYDAIVRVDARFSNNVAIHGSGVMIAPDEVLTAAHMVWQVDDGGAATQVTVTPALYGSDSPFGTIAATDWQYFPVDDHSDLLSWQSSSTDIALIHLSHAIGDGTMEIGDNVAGGQHYDSGYPGNPGVTQNLIRTGVTADPTVPQLWDLASTLGPGSSGGPIWDYDNSGHAYVMGVNSTSTPSGAGYAPDLTDQLVSQINSWMQADHPGNTEYLAPLDPNHSLWRWV